MLTRNWALIKYEQFTFANDLKNINGLCLQTGDGSDVFRKAWPLLETIQANLQLTLFFNTSPSPGCITDQLSAELLLLFFHPNYYVADNRPVVFIPMEFSEADPFIDMLRTQCIEQGFAGLTTLSITDDSAIANTASVVHGYLYGGRPSIVNELIATGLSTFMETGNFFAIELLVHAPDEPALRLLADELAEQTQAAEWSAPGKTAAKMYALHATIRGLQKKLAQQDVHKKNLEDYLAIQKKDLAIALNWYHFEYDILPLWFKRLGHIIKVIVGKRSFRSLFDDNVKKYKD